MPNGRQNNKRHPFERVKRWLKLWRYKILRIDDPPERIARGAAIGVLMGCSHIRGRRLPRDRHRLFTQGKQGRRVLGSFIVNPLTSPFFWTLSIIIGSFITGEDSSTILARMKHDGILASAGRPGSSTWREHRHLRRLHAVFILHGEGGHCPRHRQRKRGEEAQEAGRTTGNVNR